MFYFMDMSVLLHVMSVYHVSAFGGQQRALIPLGLELQTAVSCYVGAENQIWVLSKSSQCSYY